MSGLTSRLSERIQKLRVEEIVEGSQFRMVQVYTAVLAFVPLNISPVIAFAAFTGLSRAAGKTLDTSRLFTSLSLIQLLATPLVQTFQVLPIMAASLGCLQRIQKFLLAESRSDHRIEVSTLDAGRRSHPHPDQFSSDVIAMENLRPKVPNGITSNGGSEVILVRNGTFGWKHDAPVISDVNIAIRQSEVAILIGPIASGKSTLLKALLGETESSKGFVFVSSTDFAFCDQTPWLINASIKKNIIGFADFDENWYNNVVHASALEEDLAIFAKGDETLIGSAGITLSGGQKQRVAIARAVYARKTVALFDDVFSGFDRITEQIVFHRIFGPQGLLRLHGTTVILATHNQSLLRFADRVFELEGGKVTERKHTTHFLSSHEVQAELAIKPIHHSQQAPLNAVDNPSASKPCQETSAKQHGDMAVYRYYFDAIGTSNTIFFFVFQAAFALLTAFPSTLLLLEYFECIY